jgi:hypothetical protein
VQIVFSKFHVFSVIIALYSFSSFANELLEVVRKNDVHRATTLLDGGFFQVNHRDEVSGETALDVAYNRWSSMGDNKEMIFLLMQRGALQSSELSSAPSFNLLEFHNADAADPQGPYLVPPPRPFFFGTAGACGDIVVSHAVPAEMQVSLESSEDQLIKAFVMACRLALVKAVADGQRTGVSSTGTHIPVDWIPHFLWNDERHYRLNDIFQDLEVRFFEILGVQISFGAFKGGSYVTISFANEAAQLEAHEWRGYSSETAAVEQAIETAIASLRGCAQEFAVLDIRGGGHTHAILTERFERYKEQGFSIGKKIVYSGNRRYVAFVVRKKHA